MTMWVPQLDDRDGPRYRAIADALQDDLAAGRLSAGERLPTHRDLAERLGVTVGTVSRAYAEAERRGLVSGEVGRGTFVKTEASGPQRFGEPTDPEDGGSRIDLSLSVPATPVNDDEQQVIAEGFARLAERPDLAALLGAHPFAGRQSHRAAGAAWLSRFGVDAEPENVLVTAGAQHGLVVTFATLTSPGDVVVTDEVTYPGMKGIANLLRLRLKGLPTDAEGLLPDALGAACRQGDVRALYTTPTVHNPTGRVMGAERRAAIAAIAREHGVPIVEDDAYGFLPEERPAALVSHAPELGVFLMGCSKLIAPAVRVGFLAAPAEIVGRLGAAIWTTVSMAPPTMAEVVAGWIEDGTAERFAAWKRVDAVRRQAVAREVLDGVPFDADPASYHLWLELPEPWRSEEFVVQAARRGVAVSSAEAFVVGRTVGHHAVRVSLSGPRDLAELEKGLKIVAKILACPPEPCRCVI